MPNLSHCGTVVTDGSLGAARTLTGPNYSILPSMGQTRGSNLFQSFKSFDLSAGDVATFTGPSNVTNVLARVTGGQSNINGILACSIPRAAFYLINPNGVVFGPDAALDVSGSFTVTTANEVKLADGGKFNTAAPSRATLSSATPAAFGFTFQHPVALTINGSLLRVPSKHSITVAAGPVTLTESAMLRTPAGTVGILSVASPATAEIIADGAPAPNSAATLGDVSISGNSEILTSGAGGGGIAVDARNLTMTDSGFEADTLGAMAGKGVLLTLGGSFSKKESYIYSDTSGSGEGGNIEINAQSIDTNGEGGSKVGTQAEVEGNAVGHGGSIKIRADTITITGGEDVDASSYAIGNAGDVSLTANDLTIDDRAGGPFGSASVSSTAYASGNGGAVSLQARSISVIAGGQISTNTFGAGSAGDISIVAHDLKIDDRDSSEYSVSVVGSDAGGGSGHAGSIRIHAVEISVRNGSMVESSTFTNGNAGNISITTNNLLVTGTGVDPFDMGSPTIVDASAQAVYGAGYDNSGLGGAVSIRAQSVDISDSAEIDSSAFAQGNAGDIAITSDRFTITDHHSGSLTGLFSTAGNAEDTLPSTGNGGQINVATNTLDIDGYNAQIIADTFVDGAAGKVVVAASKIHINGHDSPGFVGISSSSSGRATGAAGGVLIQANSGSGELLIERGGTVAASSAAGSGGSVGITEPTVVINHSSISASAATSGGNVILKTNALLLEAGGSISATSKGGIAGDNGGNVTIDKTELALSAGVGAGAISANAVKGLGGNISVQSGGDVLAAPGINPSTYFTATGSKPGIISIQSPEVDLAGEVASLAIGLTSPQLSLAPTCAMQVGTDQSSFTLEGGNGLPADPGMSSPSGIHSTTQPAPR